MTMPGSELIGKEERDAVMEIFDQGLPLSRRPGSRVQQFEEAVAKKIHSAHAHALASGTAGLFTVLKAMNIGPGDEVITQSHTFVATVEAITEIGATPVIAEIDETLNMDPADLESLITEKTKAIIPVHMLGISAQMDKILSIAKKHKIPVLEDSAQAPGGKFKNQYLGTLGSAGVFSFDYGKLITTGEGGMVFTQDRELYLRVREYADHGHEQNPNFPRGEDTRRSGGFNFKMTEIQATIGLVQLTRLDFALACLKKNKQAYKQGLSEIKGIGFRKLPDADGDICDTIVFFLPDKEKALRCAKLLKEKNIGTKNLPDAVKWHYAGTWDHMLRHYPRYKNTNLSACFPQSDKILSRSIALPINIKMSETEIQEKTATIKKVVDSIVR
jgi:8-amino-3,8-dideoxy-alpha-D-manno-octulosonate transaminase